MQMTHFTLKHDQLTLLGRSTEAPDNSRQRTTSIWPALADRCRGVIPCYSTVQHSTY